MVNKSTFAAASRLATHGLSLLMPSVCAICEQTAPGPNPLCTTCEKLIEKQQLDINYCCLACALPLKATSKTESSTEAPLLCCADCQQQKPVFNRCIAAVAYNALTGKLIHRLKHSGNLSLLKTITRQMQAAINPLYLQPADLIVPVPLHSNRLTARGFNQSAEIAKLLGLHFDIPVDITACRRLRDDPPQQSLNRAHRQQNLTGAFEFTRQLTGLRVAIVDDVVTTGATGCALAQTALQAGAVAVDIWSYARTPAPGYKITL